MPPYEATLTKNLRDAGAIILAKTVLTELANWVAGAPSPMPANYSALAGYGFNPYDPRRDPREATFDGRPALSTGGSSSGIGTAASFWAANVGTETSGSILSPANQNMLVGIKPTVGRVSRYGVIPITADQDTPGPMARSVRDAAILLGALEGAAPDPGDEATKTCTPPPGRDYTRFLDAGALKGARIGVPRAFYYDKATPPGAKEPRGGLNPDQAKVMAEAIEILRAQGATVVDPADIPSVVDADERRNLLLWGICGGADEAKGKDASCSVVFKYGMKRDFNKWLAEPGRARAGEDARRAAPLERGPPEGGRDQVRPVAARHLGRDAARAGSRPLRGRPREGRRARRHARHPRGDEGPGARRAVVPGRKRRVDRRAAGLPDRDRPVRDGAERADAAVSRGLRGAAGALRRELHRPLVQRAAAHRARLRLRAGDEAPPPAGGVSLIQLHSATLAAKPIVVAASGTTCSISASVTPASRALRTAE